MDEVKITKEIYEMATEKSQKIGKPKLTGMDGIQSMTVPNGLIEEVR